MARRRRTYCIVCRRKVNKSALCPRCKDIQYRWHVDPKDIHALHIDQAGRCKVCGDFPHKNRSLSIDHDHTTRKIRGLLCTRCNMGLGYLSSIELLRKGIEYLGSPLPTITEISVEPRCPRISKTQKTLAKNTLANPLLITMGDKARSLSAFLNISFDAAMSRLRRTSV